MSVEPIKLSVVIITLNEEKNIGKCLNAAWQVADEIVVVDSFSTDRTKEICQEKRARFIEHKFDGHIEQKNFAITQATYDHILSLDADEVVSEELIESIILLKSNWSKSAYSINRKSFYCGKFINHGDWYPDRKVRLFKKDSGKWGGNNPHDLFIVGRNKKTGHLAGDLHHYTFNSVAEHISQANKFSSIGARVLIEDEYKTYVLKILLHPIWRFVRSYFIRLGFLDGIRGLTISIVIAIETFLKYVKVYFPIYKHPFYNINVIHISSMETWRGGEQQVANLLIGQKKLGLNILMVAPPDSALIQFCEKNDIPFRTLRFNNGFNFYSAIKLMQLSKRFQADIIHMHCSPSHTLSVFSKMMGNPAKLVLSRRVIFPVRPNFFSYKKFNYSGIVKIICVSNSIQEVLKQTLKDTNKLSLVYDGIEITKFSKLKPNNLREEFGLNGKKIIGNISAVVPEKDYFTFVDTAELVLKKDKNVHFLIVGSGKDEETIRNYIESKALESNITMLGFRNDVPELLSIFDVFLMTSTMEGLGSTLLDAFASKVPVVATKIGGIPEIVKHEITGLLTETKDSVELANCVLRILNDKEFSNTLIENAYQQVNRKFGVDNMVLQTNVIYKSVISI